MRCFHPLDGWQREAGGPLVFHSKHGYVVKRTVRCGQCIGCRVDRSKQWSIRCVHESSMHDVSSFVTLTYDEMHLPRDCGLHYRDFQLFMKRLRKQQKCRFFMCGEYGAERKRPHFHACLFGVGFGDRVPAGCGDSGFQQYESKRLSELWPNGGARCGDVTAESAQYVAGYVHKKVTGHAAEYVYERVDGDTGECFFVDREFCRMSLKPGIGEEWYAKFARDVAVHDGIVSAGGVRAGVPRYYRVLRELQPDAVALAWMHAGAERVVDYSVDAGVERLAAQERVAVARHNLKRRSL